MEVLIVLAILGVVMGLLIGPKLIHGQEQARRRQAQIEEAQLVNAYAQWSWDHSGSACPQTLTELGQYVRRRHMNDPWGTAYEMLCGRAAPPPAQGFGVLSYANDRTRGTDDDIASWDSQP